jgi:predicted 2-oxoglutarate/Fe(II)-dependent dioxygenase YbiX
MSTTLSIGDPAPWFAAPTAGNPQYSFASVAGRHVLLVFAGAAHTAAAAATHQAMREAMIERLFAPDRAIAFTVSTDRRDAQPGGPRDALPGHRVFLDYDGGVTALFGMRDACGAILLDPMLRVVRIGPVAALLDQLRALPRAVAPDAMPAPVLLLPNVFEPELCRHLIAQYEQSGGEESGFMVARDGRTVGVLDARTKRRRDAEVTDPGLQAAIRARVGRRVVPELRKACHFEATRIERYLVACYSAAERGHFRAHRDDTTPATAHRRFAVTINLNDGFDGGELWFPEFGQRRWRAPPGGAIVFSCRLLHEATPVTSGTRFACLPFLYDEAAEAVRQANRAAAMHRDAA